MLRSLLLSGQAGSSTTLLPEKSKNSRLVSDARSTMFSMSLFARYSSTKEVLFASRAMSVRDAAFSASEEVDVDNAVGRVLSAASVGCPPAVPIVMCGEIIDIQATETFKYYGIEKCCVIK